MAAAPSFNYIYPTDNTSFITAATFVALQNNVSNFGLQFMPLVGGTFAGPVNWAPAQSFPALGVQVADPAYAHTGFWQTLADHIADGGVHRVAGPPQAHGSSHQLSGSDPIFGDQVSISSGSPGTSVKTYVDTTFASATATIAANYTPSSRYAIGGADPLYGTSVGVSAASGSVSVKSYIDTQLTNALAGPFPQNPSFQTVTLSASASTISFVNNVSILANGYSILNQVGSTTYLQTPTTVGTISLGGSGGTAAYGSFTSGGYTIGSSNIGPSSGVVNGPFTSNYDLQVNRSSQSAPNTGAIQFAASLNGAYLAYNADIANSFFFSKQLTVGGNLAIANGNAFSINGVFGIATTSQVTTLPALKSDGTNVNLNAKDTGTIGLGKDNASLTAIQLGPSGAWGSFDGAGIHLGSSTLSGSGASIAGATTIVGALTLNGGNALGTANFGSNAGTRGVLDFGVTSNGTWTFAGAGATLAQIKTDGTYAASASSYGPLSATINGTVTANKAIYAAAGIGYAGTGGYTFTGNSTGDTGLFSTGPGDLRLVTTAANALAFTSNGTQANFLGNVNVPILLSTQSFSASGNALVGGSLTINGALNTGNTSITKFRTKAFISLGFNAGVTATSTVYPNIVSPAYTGGLIEAIRLAAVTADGTSTQSTWSIYKNNTLIGTIALPNGGTTALSLPVSGTVLIAAGDQLKAVCTQAGTSTGVTIELEISQLVY